MAGKKRKFQPTQLYTIPADIESAVPTLAHIQQLSSDGRRVYREDQVFYVPGVEAGQSSQDNPTLPVAPSFDVGMDLPPPFDNTHDDIQHVFIEEPANTRRFATQVSSNCHIVLVDNNSTYTLRHMTLRFRSGQRAASMLCTSS